MLIKDSPGDRNLTIRALKKNNVLNPVTIASNGAEALTMLFADDHRDQGNIDVQLHEIRQLAYFRRWPGKPISIQPHPFVIDKLAYLLRRLGQFPATQIKFSGQDAAPRSRRRHGKAAQLFALV